MAPKATPICIECKSPEHSLEKWMVTCITCARSWHQSCRADFPRSKLKDLIDDARTKDSKTLQWECTRCVNKAKATRGRLQQHPKEVSSSTQPSASAPPQAAQPVAALSNLSAKLDNISLNHKASAPPTTISLLDSDSDDEIKILDVGPSRWSTRSITLDEAPPGEQARAAAAQQKMQEINEFAYNLWRANHARLQETIAAMPETQAPQERSTPGARASSTQTAQSIPGPSSVSRAISADTTLVSFPLSPRLAPSPTAAASHRAAARGVDGIRPTSWLSNLNKPLKSPELPADTSKDIKGKSKLIYPTEDDKPPAMDLAKQAQSTRPLSPPSSLPLPPVPDVPRTASGMPDFRAMMSDLRLAGQLNAPHHGYEAATAQGIEPSDPSASISRKLARKRAVTSASGTDADADDGHSTSLADESERDTSSSAPRRPFLMRKAASSSKLKLRVARKDSAQKQQEVDTLEKLMKYLWHEGRIPHEIEDLFDALERRGAKKRPRKMQNPKHLKTIRRRKPLLIVYGEVVE